MYYYYETATGNSQWEYPKSTTQMSTPQTIITQPSVVSVAVPTLPAIPAFPSSHVLALQTQQMMMTAVAPGYAGMMMSAALTTPMVAPPVPAIPLVQTFTPPLPTTDTKKRPGDMLFQFCSMEILILYVYLEFFCFYLMIGGQHLVETFFALENLNMLKTTLCNVSELSFIFSIFGSFKKKTYH